MNSCPKRKLGAPSQAAVAAKAQRMIGSLRQQHALGKAALLAQTNGVSTAELAAKHGYSEHTMRKIRAFARNFSNLELEELCSSHRPNGLPLHWGYVSVLLAIQGKHGVAARRRFQRLAIREGWTVPRLYREVRERLGVSGHGRTVHVPAEAEEGLGTLLDGVELLQRRADRLTVVAGANGDSFTSQRCRRLSLVLAKAKAVLTG
jgi:hypothetical protein